MVIHSGIITLDYDPSTDILESAMPDLRQLSISEVNYCLKLIGDSIRSYDIKYYLLDASKSILDMEDSDYKEAMRQFGQYLMSTRLKKLARVSTSDSVREEKAAKLGVELRQETTFAFEFRTFASRAEALEWLKENNN